MLIIEYNKDVRSYIVSIFINSYLVEEVENGEAGVEKALQWLPDLIISDIMMLGMDGFESCHVIKTHAQTAHIPVIMLTARQEEADLLEATRCGADDYLMKPFNPELLKAKVVHLIQQREKLKQIYTRTLLLTPDNEETREDDFMQQVINIIEIYLDDPQFNVNILADKLCMSTPTLYRKIKSHSNLSIKEVIRGIRMSKAATLLLTKKYSVQEVAEMVSFNDIATFRKHFTKQFGTSPSQYIH
ncbi:MAG: response regulator [Tannerellaceae bacterium]|nr:response regulator [Tannerellaceae bacterium]